jgi:hypothetical protein
MLADFFKGEIAPYLDDSDLDPAGAAIVRACLNDAETGTYERLIRPFA